VRALVVPRAVVAEVRACADRVRQAATEGTALHPGTCDATIGQLHDAAPDWGRVRMFAALLRCALRRGEGCRKLVLPTAHGLDADGLRLLFLALGQALGTLVEPWRSTAGDPLQEAALPTGAAAARFRTSGSAAPVPPDFVGWFCQHAGAGGAHIRLSQALRVRQKLANHKPSVLRLLQRGYRRDAGAAGVDRTGTDRVDERIPVFVDDDEPAGWTLRYARTRIERGQAQAEEPLSREARAALDLLDELLDDPENVIQVELGAGDMLWCNNRTLAHAVEPEASAEDPARLLQLTVVRQRSQPSGPR